jgi:2-polyprenyl-3-methyl-5-hydroxy-6-metoxy-1,4-benzoquinol methylase
MTTQQRASFRDPEGRVFFRDSRVFRALNAAGESSLRHTMGSAAVGRFLQTGAIVETRFLPPDEVERLLHDPDLQALLADFECRGMAEHAAAPFPSYPHEWAPEMLHAAGELTLDLACGLLADGIGLKDATPTNVMFWGPKPVFLDVLSFEKRDPCDPTWLPYAQFVRMFLLPLLVNGTYGIPSNQIFMTRNDGLQPEDAYRMLGTLDRLKPRILPLISLPVWLGKRSASASPQLYQPRRLKNAEQAQYIMNSLLRRQKRALERLRPKAHRESTWSDYAEGNNNYSSAQAVAKVTLVRRALEEIRPADVLDIGCNTGIFSQLAAEAGARVVAADFDPVVVGQLWTVAKRKNAAILPLVVNIARPTPALGWLNGESRSFLDRATGAFDVVMMLALLHHLIVTERIPLPEIFELARRLTKKWLIIEYVAPADSMFQVLTRGRAHLHDGFNQSTFEAVAARYFRIVRSEQIPGAERRLYVMEIPD